MAANEGPKFDYEVFEGLEPLDPNLPWDYYPNDTTAEEGSKEAVVVSPMEKEPPSTEQQLPPPSPVVDKEMYASKEMVVVSPTKKDPSPAEQQLSPLSPVIDEEIDASEDAVVISQVKNELSPVVDQEIDISEETAVVSTTKNELPPVVDQAIDASEEEVVVSSMKNILSPVVDQQIDASEVMEVSSVEKEPTSAEQQLPPVSPAVDKKKDASGSRSRGRPKRELKWPDWLPRDWHIQTKKRKSGQIDKNIDCKSKGNPGYCVWIESDSAAVVSFIQSKTIWWFVFQKWIYMQPYLVSIPRKITHCFKEANLVANYWQNKLQRLVVLGI